MSASSPSVAAVVSDEPAYDTMSHKTRYSRIQPCPGVPLPADVDSLPVLTRPEIATRISKGELLVIHLPLVYKLPHSWLANHPGGDLALLHFVGRDASNELEMYHSGWTVAKRMSLFIVGRVEVDDNGWIDMVPPVQLHRWPVPVANLCPLEKANGVNFGATCDFKDSEKDLEVLTPEMIDPPHVNLDEGPLTHSYQHHLRQEARKLHAKMHAAGLMDRPAYLAGYANSLVGYATLFVAWIFLFYRAETWKGYLLAGCVKGMWWHQVTFVAHDAGHSTLTQDWWTDRLICTFVANCLGGLSAGWWADSHNVHHMMTNAPEHDPDVQLLPFFAITDKFFQTVRSSYRKQLLYFDEAAKLLIPYQHNFYYIVMAVARFNLFRESYTFLYRTNPYPGSPLHKFKRLELAGLCFFWTWYGSLLYFLYTRVSFISMALFVLSAFICSSPVHVQIVLSHLSQPVNVLHSKNQQEELSESFAHRQLRTTMDVSCPQYLDFIHGGLNFQVGHHLHPRMPRFHFRAGQAIVQQWAQEEQARIAKDGWKGKPLKEGEGLDYKTMTFVEGNQDVLRVLRDIADQVKVMGLVASKVAHGEIHAH